MSKIKTIIIDILLSIIGFGCGVLAGLSFMLYSVKAINNDRRGYDMGYRGHGSVNYKDFYKMRES